MNNVNPAWKPMLDKIPPELQQLVIPIFQEWDQGVQKKFQDIRNEYSELEAYKKFAENNIDPEYVEQAVMLADNLQRDPQGLVDQVNQAWNLGYVSKDDAEKLGQHPASPSMGAEDDDFLDGDDDILKNPKVKAMYDALNELQSNYQSDREQERQAQELAEFEEYLDTLENKAKTDNLPFHRTFVTALISQGMDGEAAVKQYHQVLAAQSVDGEIPNPAPTNDDTSGQEPPPVVMGSVGNVGSGSADGSVDFGSLSRGDLNKTVMDLLTAAENNGQ